MSVRSERCDTFRGIACTSFSFKADGVGSMSRYGVCLYAVIPFSKRSS